MTERIRSIEVDYHKRSGIESAIEYIQDTMGGIDESYHISIDTNKQTYEKEFSSGEEAIEWLENFSL